MRNSAIVFIIISLFFFVSCEKTKRVRGPITVMFYNVENLFDTIDTPNKFDEEFMPVEPKNWNTERYEKKLSDLSRVITSVDTVNLPSIIGVCEVENDVVLHDLVMQPTLKSFGYKMVWEDGPDFRGIDCALLYNPDVFTVISYESLPVISPKDADFHTRDILYVQGNLGKELFHIFVNHWPSRRGGEEVSEPKRVLAAKVLRQKVDEIFKSDQMANIIIMGDMNDEPGNISLSDILMALPNDQKSENNQLVNLMHDEFDDDLGSYAYRDQWNMIDNMVVSGALINKTKGLKSSLNNGFIFHKPFMEFVNKNGQMSPNRTYGRAYYGGISDHFPIYMILE